MKTCTHHIKSKSDIPAWLWFSFYPVGLPYVKDEQKDKLMQQIKKNLMEHLHQHGLQNTVITEPNKYDALPKCDKCQK